MTDPTSSDGSAPRADAGDDPLSVGVLGYRFTGQANALARLPIFFPDAPAVERSVLVGRDETALAAAADRPSFESTAVVHIVPTPLSVTSWSISSTGVAS